MFVHDYKMWVTWQYRRYNFEILIRFPILKYHTTTVDLKTYVVDYIIVGKLLSHNCVFDIYFLDDDELPNFICVSCLDMLILLTVNITNHLDAVLPHSYAANMMSL